MQTTRIHEWQIALEALLKTRWSAPFTWGQQDCCLFAADCVLAVTGSDPAEDVRGAYSTEAGAARLLRQHGGAAKLAEERLGEEIAPLFMQVGDVALVHVAERDMLAVCFGPHLLAPGPDGLVYVPLDHALRAWRCTRAE